MPENGKSPPTNLKLLWHKSLKFRYLAIGAWNTLAGYAIFAGLYLALSKYIGYIVIAVLSHMIAVTQSFTTQRWIVFRSAGNIWAEYMRFHIAHLGSLAMGLVGLSLAVEILRIPPLIAQAMITALIVIASYFIHQYFTFRKAKDV